MEGRSYRLNTSTLAIDTVEGQRVAITVPAGAVITIEKAPPQGGRLADILFDGRTVMMFAIDIEERGTLIKQAEA